MCVYETHGFLLGEHDRGVTCMRIVREANLLQALQGSGKIRVDALKFLGHLGVRSLCAAHLLHVFRPHHHAVLAARPAPVRTTLKTFLRPESATAKMMLQT